MIDFSVIDACSTDIPDCAAMRYTKSCIDLWITLLLTFYALYLVKRKSMPTPRSGQYQYNGYWKSMHPGCENCKNVEIATLLIVH